MDNMNSLSAAIEDQRKKYLTPSEQKDTNRWVGELLEHILNGISAAKGMYPTKPVEAVCEVANVLSISLGDESVIGDECSEVRCEVFGRDDAAGISFLYRYIHNAIDAVGTDKVMDFTRRCASCCQAYVCWFPKEWNDGRDAAAVKKATRASNTNSSYEFMCLSGMCDACWQKHFNKEESDG